MTPFHASELTLPRPATQGGLRHARARVRPTANADRTRLVAAQSAQPGRAAAPTGHATAIDVLTTHYPNRSGRVLLNIAIGPLSRCGLPPGRSSPGQRLQDVLGQCAVADRAQHEQERARRPEKRIESLFAHTTIEEVLVCAARTGTASITTASRQRREPIPGAAPCRDGS